MYIRKSFFAVFSFLLFTQLPAYSDEEGVIVSFDGYYRMRGHYLNKLDQREKRNNVGFLDMRFRLEPEFKISENLSVKAQIDMLDNVVWGFFPAKGEISFLENSPNTYGIDSLSDSAQGNLTEFFYPTGISRVINVKRVWIEILFFLGKLKIGRMDSNWGMGIYENDGNEYTRQARRLYGDTFRQEWGMSKYGDTRDSILFATKPFGMDKPFVVALGMDRFSEGNIYSPSDDKNRWFLIPLYMDRERKIYGGAHLSFLIQTGTDTRLGIFDPYIRINMPFLKDLMLEAEATIYVGETKAYASDKPFGMNGNKLDVFAVNAVGRVNYEINPIDMLAEVGYSSPEKKGFNDGKLSSIPIDPDFNISLLMFEYVNAYYTGLLAENSNLTSAESQFVRSNGSISNALWSRFQLKFAPVETITSSLQLLWAQGLEPIIYSYGQNTNARGVQNPAKHYGWELDYNFHFGLGEHLAFDFQLGFLWPGKGLSQYLAQDNSVRKNDMIFGMFGGFTAKF